jgi:hypothetical protein
MRNDVWCVCGCHVAVWRSAKISRFLYFREEMIEASTSTAPFPITIAVQGKHPLFAENRTDSFQNCHITLPIELCSPTVAARNFSKIQNGCRERPIKS